MFNGKTDFIVPILQNRKVPHFAMHQKQSSPPVTPHTVQLLFLDTLPLVTHSRELHADKLYIIPLNYKQKKKLYSFSEVSCHSVSKELTTQNKHPTANS
jgi:hypothetical protein